MRGEVPTQLGCLLPERCWHVRWVVGPAARSQPRLLQLCGVVLPAGCGEAEDAEAACQVAVRLAAIKPCVAAQVAAATTLGVEPHSARGLVSRDVLVRANAAKHHGFGSDFTKLSVADCRRAQRGAAGRRAVAKDDDEVEAVLLAVVAVDGSEELFVGVAFSEEPKEESKAVLQEAAGKEEPEKQVVAGDVPEELFVGMAFPEEPKEESKAGLPVDVPEELFVGMAFSEEPKEESKAGLLVAAGKEEMELQGFQKSVGGRALGCKETEIEWAVPEALVHEVKAELVGCLETKFAVPKTGKGLEGESEAEEHGFQKSAVGGRALGCKETEVAWATPAALVHEVKAELVGHLETKVVDPKTVKGLEGESDEVWQYFRQAGDNGAFPGRAIGQGGYRGARGGPGARHRAAKLKQPWGQKAEQPELEALLAELQAELRCM